VCNGVPVFLERANIKTAMAHSFLVTYKTVTIKFRVGILNFKQYFSVQARMRNQGLEVRTHEQRGDHRRQKSGYTDRTIWTASTYTDMLHPSGLGTSHFKLGPSTILSAVVFGFLSRPAIPSAT
jgi:hypothetical protein